MRQNRLTLVVAVAVAAVLIARMVVYQVRDDEVAVVLTFGRATDDVTTPRTGLKWPWPIQQVRHFDARLRVLRTPLEEVATRDGRAVLVGSFVLWRVSSARAFLERFGDADEAAHHLEKLLRSRQSETVSRYEFGALVSTDPQQLKYVEIEQRIQELLAADLARDGLEVKLVGIRRLALPQEATEAVFQRMKKDREARAAALQAEGAAEAAKIRAKADEEKATLVGQARAHAEEVLGQAESEAEQAYRIMAQEPQLAIFLRKLDAMEKLLGRRAVLVFGRDDPPFDLLGRGSAAPVESRTR